MNAKEIMQSKYFQVIMVTTGVCIVALSSFVLGVTVGIHKAKFSSAWGENYERNFIGERGNMMDNDERDERRNGIVPGNGMMNRFGFDKKTDGRNFRNAHGIAGKVLSVSDTSIIITDKDNKENVIAVTEKTLFKQNGEDVQLSDIVKDDSIVVIGKPSDNGVVNADFIRVFKQATVNK